MEPASLKKIAEHLSIPIMSVIVLLVLDWIPSFIEVYRIPLLIILIIALILLILIILVSENIYESIWKIKHKNVLRKSHYAILRVEGCPRKATRYTPHYWRRFLGLRCQCNYIRVEEINNDYVAIINPYGEIYPEEDVLSGITFKRIIKYVKSGGIFVNAGGLAFYYCWNERTIGTPSTAKEVHGLGGTISRNQISLQPTYTLPPSMSLVDTITSKEFGLLTSTDKPCHTRCTQNLDDIDFCGEISGIGGTDEIIEFRAIRQPIQSCIPILRAITIVGNNQIPVFPLACVPFGKGKFIFCGLLLELPRPGDLNSTLTNPQQLNRQTLDTIIDSHPRKIVRGLKNIIENERLEFGIE